MNGFDVCNTMKSDEKLKDIPIIFISALNDTANKVKALTEGGVDYITKPFQADEVLARVETHLKLRKAQRDLQTYNQHLEERVQEQVQEITQSQFATLTALSRLAEYRDDTTGSHIQRTSDYCRMLATYLAVDSPDAESITPAFIRDIHLSAPLHDIGKVGIPDSILLKSGKLTTEEFDLMKTHVNIGVLTLQKVLEKHPKNSFVNMGIILTKHHHEKWNGKGYPDGLAGEEIPLPARIMALADVYDALRSKRPYKDGFSHEKAVEIIREDSGKSFDPVIVDAFLALEREFDRVFDQME